MDNSLAANTPANTPANSVDLDQTYNECVICYTKNNTIKTPCSHSVCSECIFKLPNVNCPICRTNMFSNMSNSGLNMGFGQAASFEIILDPIDADRLRLNEIANENISIVFPEEITDDDLPIVPNPTQTYRRRMRRESEYSKLLKSVKMYQNDKKYIVKKIKRNEKRLKYIEDNKRVAVKKLHDYRLKKGKTRGLKTGYCSYRSVYYNPEGEKVTYEEAVEK